MIISHKHKFIFIKTRKTAGTSIEAYLKQFLGEDDIVSPDMLPKDYDPFVESLYQLKYFTISKRPAHLKASLKALLGRDTTNRKHIPAVSIRSRVPKQVWNSYFKFCFEREPLDKNVSFFKYRKENHIPTLTWESFIKSRNFCYNYPQYTDFNGNVIVDYVGRYENLEEEMKYICGRIGIPYHGLPRENVSKDRTSYIEFYDLEERKLIEQLFAKEVSKLEA